MKRGLQLLILSLLAIPLLAGCMFPKEKLAQNQIAYDDQVQAVQTAVKQYQEESGGLLPIKTRDQETPIYQKYPIDFKKLIPKYMAEAPGNAYESGGVFQYVLVDVEDDPKVKIYDLRIPEAIRDIKLRIAALGYPPYNEQIADNVYTLDYTKIGLKEAPSAQSPYSQLELPFVVTPDAQVYVDYTPDLIEALKGQKTQVKPGEDIRHLLVEDSLFVPAYSLPYTLDETGKKPVFLETQK